MPGRNALPKKFTAPGPGTYASQGFSEKSERFPGQKPPLAVFGTASRNQMSKSYSEFPGPGTYMHKTMDSFATPKYG